MHIPDKKYWFHGKPEFILLILFLFLITACSRNGSRITPTVEMDSSQPPITVEKTAQTELETKSPTPTIDILPTPLIGTTPSVDLEATIETTASLPDPKGYVWKTLVDGLDAPVFITHAADGSGRLFVLEQKGLIRLIRDGIFIPEPFLDIRDQVGSKDSEQGLLGLAFHPNFPQNGYFYVNYTDLKGDTVVSRFEAPDSRANTVDPTSERILMTIPQPYANHNGGMLAFGPDRYLYIATGDGGSAGDPLNNSQSLGTRLGKILRIDVDKGDPYAIPPENPFINDPASAEIWVYGLRNPWRFSFDRLSGDIYIGDVGQNQWEEIDYLPAGSPPGANFGWRYYEGTHPYEGIPPEGSSFIDPVIEYDHNAGCSVTGGVVYRGNKLTDFLGVYLYSDFCTGTIWGLIRDPEKNWQSRTLFNNMGKIVSFGEDETGEIYLVDLAGSIRILERQ